MQLFLRAAEGHARTLISQGRGFYAQELSVAAFPYVKDQGCCSCFLNNLIVHLPFSSRSQREKEAWNRGREPGMAAARFSLFLLLSSFYGNSLRMMTIEKISYSFVLHHS